MLSWDVDSKQKAVLAPEKEPRHHSYQLSCASVFLPALVGTLGRSSKVTQLRNHRSARKQKKQKIKIKIKKHAKKVGKGGTVGVAAAASKAVSVPGR